MKNQFSQKMSHVKKYVCDICPYGFRKNGFRKKPLPVKMIFLSMFSFLLLIILVSFYSSRAEATDIHKPVRCVTSICINDGESLWSIASKYYTDGEGDMNDYIDEIKKTNHLKTDRIHAGSFLIIPYYDCTE